MLETLKNNNVCSYCTDLARINGVGYNATSGFGCYWIDGQYTIYNKKHNKETTNNMNYIDTKGAPNSTIAKMVSGVRIAISFDDIEDFDINRINELKIDFPQTIIDARVINTLNKLFETKSKLIISTGRKRFIKDKVYDEFEALGIKFFKINNKYKDKMLSDGTTYDPNTDVYLKVEQIPLIIDEKARLIYSADILFGADFDGVNRKFEESDLNKLLNGEFLKGINGELDTNERKIYYNDQQLSIKNRYKFDFSPLSEEEIIEICINSNIAVFLHGQTGVGKTERMLALDNNLELIDFGCTSSDGFTGIIAKDFNSKELFLYEPYWYKNLCQKCEAEPDKIHILFLEELTNARNDVQKVAFEVTLNKTLTNSGFRLKLPDNAVVCAAGNEASESKSASALSEPLFGRFAHVYINTNSDEWLKWAYNRKKNNKKLLYHPQIDHEDIHPAILNYIKVNGDKVLRTAYDGVNPNADPRKWVLASKALYQCNNPNVLRAFVGDSITKDFINFCKMDIVSVEDVLNDRCDADDIPFDPSLRWYTTICLSIVDDENVDKVREFVRKLGKEFLAVFDYEWSKDNEERIMKIYELNEPVQVKRLVPNGNE